MANVLGIQEQAWQIFLSGGTILYLLQWNAPDINNNPAVNQAIQIGTPQNPSASTPIFPDVGTALTYYRTTMASLLMSNINSGNANNYFTSYTVSNLVPEVQSSFDALAAVAFDGNATSLNDYANLVTSTILSGTLGGYATSSSVAAGLGAKFDSPSGSTSQYVRGDGSLIAFPTIPSAQIQSDWNQSNNGLLDFIKNKPVIPSTARTTSTLSLSLVGTGATGTQISSSKDASVSCCVSTSTTSTIGGPATSVVALKICATNNVTEGSWTTVTTFESDQNITLAVILQSVQVVKGQLCADVPAGWFVKLVNSGTGTHAEAFVSGQQTIYG